jgi:hypothetical protein
MIWIILTWSAFRMMILLLIMFNLVVSDLPPIYHLDLGSVTYLLPRLLWNQFSQQTSAVPNRIQLLPSLAPKFPPSTSGSDAP